ncbi:Ceramide glucosyltransferase [Enhygromyxa salina]|uniref:Ceramide glucosyltransferase n=1 Tax=Enhygromyxa salina TaxID=215803 RepID=A0A0C2DBE2_9BACT|nr:glycosyltransferase family 2 protein [Enhygromyxa salina]KIG18730.1 Ceramide glucosyltransferase [Enhygromyxa salina]
MAMWSFAGYQALVLGAVSSGAAFLALAWAAVLAWLALGAAIQRAMMQRRFRRQARPSVAGRRVLLIRPCAGAEPELLACLSSLTRVETEAKLTVVLSVDDPHDTARPVIDAALTQLQAAGIDARFELHAPTGPNRKASMLAAVLAGAGETYEIVVNVDSNVDLSGYPLDELLMPLLDARPGASSPDARVGAPASDARVGASWGPWSELRTHEGLGPRASEAVLGASLTAFPLLCGIYGYGLCGKIWAARREALHACAPAELTEFLAEDLEMARRLRAGGWGIVATPILGRARGGDPSFSQAVARFGRWMLAVRAQRPALMTTYPLFFFATPIVLALAGLGIVAQPILAATAAGLTVFARLVVTLTAQYWSGRPVRIWRAVIEAALGDVALGLAWLRALSRREVQWRGHQLRVDRSGRLSAAAVQPVTDTQPAL